ncbi:MAG: serine/threonine-protein kinase, partial [Acidobacteria bacterium]|nr:serine/threonine-protein kinase [Acidobacteriota bacterium]
MSLPSGTRLGPYEILAPLGAGGMGMVYRAKDTRLDRTVAVKVLPADLAADLQFRERFEREARVVSSLDHPHICALYDIGRHSGIDFLVMPCLEGETLDARLKKGPLPLDELLRYGIQIADALDQAHRHSVVHRDLKPANVMLTRTGVKLLDFGLAKIEPAPIAGASASMTQQALTTQGTILGTLQYMAPEQLQGKDADARTDIFAFGAVLYEMATGRKAFEAENPASIVGAILERPAPPFAPSPPIPPALERTVALCLSKNPDDRWQSVRDIAHELKWIAETGGAISTLGLATAARRRIERLWMAAAALLLVISATLGTAYLLRPVHAPAVPVRFSIALSDGAALYPFTGPMVISPDGRHVAFVAFTEGRYLLWLRALDSLTSRRVPGTDGAYAPVWSPDSQAIAFVATGKLKAVNITGGFPRTICELPPVAGGGAGAWRPDGTILFGTLGAGVFQVAATGGAPKAVTKLDASRKETGHLWPQVLPDGQHFLYFADSALPENRGVYIGSLGSPEVRRLNDSDSNVSYAPEGYLLFTRAAQLMAQPFDAKSLALRGDAVAIEAVNDVWSSIGIALFSVSETGALAYGTVPNSNSRLVWFDRTGRALDPISEPGGYVHVALSPDERQVALERDDAEADQYGIWLTDLSRRVASRFTVRRAWNYRPVWNADGSRVAFATAGSMGIDLWEKVASGGESEQRLAELVGVNEPTDWSSDGRFVTYTNTESPTRADLWVLPLFGDRKPYPFLKTEFDESQARFSPDGRWMAYVSNESGRLEVYVRPFPGPGTKWQISPNGGSQPQWRRDGKELFYIAADHRLMAVAVKSGAMFEAAAPTV